MKSLGNAVPVPTMRRRFMAAIRPMDNGPQEIRALDGLRAVAALSIVIFHTLLFIQFEYTPLSIAVNHAWYYLSTGVDLFFVLSGFLLFLPYVRALLDSSPLPSARRFYRRRALRILPAYWVCLAILVALKLLVRHVPFSPGDVAAHIVLVNDSFPQFNRDYNGPFWTLAVEAQFYVLLPLMALLVARVCGRRRSPSRIAGGILVLIALALVLRLIDTLVIASLPASQAITTSPGGIFVLATFGMQGKYLEVFAVGMLCALLYVLSVERKMLTTRQIRRLGLAALAVTVGCMALAIPRVDLAGVMVVPGMQWGAQEIGYPLLVGLGFGGMVLAILWGGSWIRYPFEFAPMRTIGLFSYSLYLWHLPIIHGDVPLFAHLPLIVVLAGVFLVAYLSYQFVERPFLKRRHRETSSAVAPALAPAGLESTAEEPDEVSA
ncbi:MAG TPA: acyltransferase [Ktedonobacterales bacterium]|nr:acyltransferase [Ktedonobacterales bacterium]